MKKRRLLVLLALFALPFRAEAEPSRDLVISADALRSAEPRVRLEAAERLSTLSRAELPAVDARLEALKKRVIDPEEGYQALRSFAHAAGSRRADDDRDIEPGVKAKLEVERPSPVQAAIAEELLLLRSLEKIGSAEAYRRAVRIFGLHFDVFRWEARHSVKRMGMRAMPALLDAAAYGDPGLAEWARQSLGALGKPSPADALRALEGEDRAELLRAYAERRIMDAMESVAAFLDDPDPVVRKASIAAVRRYGRNAIWQIRDMARIFLGEDLDRSWSAQQSLDYLVDKLEARRLAPQREALARATELADAGDLEGARTLLDLVLAERPRMERRGVAAEVYTRLAERASSAGRHEEAARLHLKAALISPDTEAQSRSREAAAKARASAAREAGFFDPALLALAADGAAATEMVGLGEAEQDEDLRPIVALALGLALLVGLAPFRLARGLFGGASRLVARLGALAASALAPVLRRAKHLSASSMARLGAHLRERRSEAAPAADVTPRRSPSAKPSPVASPPVEEVRPSASRPGPKRASYPAPGVRPAPASAPSLRPVPATAAARLPVEFVFRRAADTRRDREST